MYLGQDLELCASASSEHQRRVVVCGIDLILQPSTSARSTKPQRLSDHISARNSVGIDNMEDRII